MYVKPRDFENVYNIPTEIIKSTNFMYLRELSKYKASDRHRRMDRAN